MAKIAPIFNLYQQK